MGNEISRNCAGLPWETPCAVAVAQGPEFLSLDDFVCRLGWESNQFDGGFSACMTLLEAGLQVFDESGNVVDYVELMESCKDAYAAGMGWRDRLPDAIRDYRIDRAEVVRVFGILGAETAPWRSLDGKSSLVPVAANAPAALSGLSDVPPEAAPDPKFSSEPAREDQDGTEEMRFIVKEFFLSRHPVADLDFQKSLFTSGDKFYRCRYWKFREIALNGGNEVDWGHWLNLESLTQHEAACLVYGVDPDYLGGLTPAHDDFENICLTKNWLHVKAAIEKLSRELARDRKIPADLTASAWAALLRKRGHDLPPAMAELEAPHMEDPKASRDPASLRNDKEQLGLQERAFVLGFELQRFLYQTIT